MLKFVVFSIVAVTCCGEDSVKPSIAIVGGGIGGSSSAYFLRQLFGNDATIDLYEAKDIGGRLATVEIAGREYESGGSIIHPANRYMKYFTQLLGLKEKDKGDGRMALYDGEKFVFDGSRYEILMVLQLFYQYGWDIVRINRFVKSLLTNFERIYEHQRAGYAFSTVESLLRSMDTSFVDMLATSTKDDMEKYGFTENFIDELVLGGLRTNYGQDTNIQSFVGSVSMAGIEPGLWSVHNGNKLVAEELIKKSQVNLVSSKVTRIKLLDGSNLTYQVTSTHDNNDKIAEYDYIIIAAPLYDNLTGIQFDDFPKDMIDSTDHFHRTVATFVNGIPNAPKFKIPNVHNFPEELITCNSKLYFNSIGKQSPVNWTKLEGEQQKQRKHLQNAVYKVFSSLPLTEDQIKDLFLSYNEVKVVDWMAYPKYPSSTNHHSNLLKFKLHRQLYYVNAIEMAASAMEMSVIGAKNVALFAHHDWTGEVSYTDSRDVLGDDWSDNSIRSEL